MFSSQLPRAPTAVTMLVTATLSRQAMIAGLCRSYGSVISLAVYVGILADDPAAAAATLAAATAALKDEFDRHALSRFYTHPDFSSQEIHAGGCRCV